VEATTRVLDLPFSLYTVSDIHLEHIQPGDVKDAAFYAAQIPEVDVIVLAGDIGWPGEESWTTFLDLCVAKADVVIYVPGNHEYWAEKPNADIHDPKTWTTEDMEEACATLGVFFLHNSTYEYEGVTFIGTTLWSPLLESGGEPVSDCVLNSMNDLRRIHGFSRTKWQNNFVTAWHFLLKELRGLTQEAKNTGGERQAIVVTHHAPAFECITEDFVGDPLNGCYASNVLQDLFGLSVLKAWVFGHTHKTMHVQRKPKRGTPMLLHGHTARASFYESVLSRKTADDGFLSSKRERTMGL
jgi:predicted phosphohydrolase